MKVPSALSTWFMLLYFLFAGLSAFVGIPFGGVLMGICALGAAITLFIGR